MPLNLRYALVCAVLGLAIVGCRPKTPYVGEWEGEMALGPATIPSKLSINIDKSWRMTSDAAGGQVVMSGTWAVDEESPKNSPDGIILAMDVKEASLEGEIEPLLRPMATQMADSYKGKTMMMEVTFPSENSMYGLTQSFGTTRWTKITVPTNE